MARQRPVEGEVNVLLEAPYDGTSTNSLDIVNDVVRFREHPIKFMEFVNNHYQGVGWRGYNDYIGARLYSPTWRDNIIAKTLERPILRKCIKELVDHRMNSEKNWNISEQQRDERRELYIVWLEDMARDIGVKAMPTFKRKKVAKLLYFTCAEVFSRSYRQGVHVSQSDIERIRAKAKELEEKKQSLILLPCHKSHVDYISLVFLFFRLGLSLPATIAGENLDMPGLGTLLRDVGALFIRRTSWSDDPLYTAYFQASIEAMLQEGVTLQCFVEGTRSRTGKLLPPKFGILKFILNTILSGAIEDAWILPISTQYDKVVEGDTYATELLGKEKSKESLYSFFESSSVILLNLGRVDIRFGEIWSLREYVVEQLQLESTVSFPLVNPISTSKSVYLLRSLGYRVLADINKASAIMPSSLVATVILTSIERGISHKQLVERVKWLVCQICQAGGSVGALPKPVNQLTDKDIAAVIDNAINVLGSSLVATESKKLLEPVYYKVNEFKLSYYRNQTIHLFVAEAIVCVALYTLYRRTNSRIIPRDELENKVSFLSSLLSGEFIFQPEGLENNLATTLATLERAQVLTVSKVGNIITLNVGSLLTGLRVFDFYCYLVWPFIDCYWSVSLSLFAIPPGGEIVEKEFLRMTQSVARTLYSQGELTHMEALNQETIKFATQQFVSAGVVIRSVNATGTSTLRLSQDWTPRVNDQGRIRLEGRLYELSEEIALSRNKRVRYGIIHTITDRMVELVQPVAASLSRPRI